METAYSSLIDFTNFGTVRRYLRSASSPITNVLFVARRELLSKVAVALDAADEQGAKLGQRQIQSWFQAGELLPGSMNAEEAHTVDLCAIDEEAVCAVIFLPPHYLVWLGERRRPRMTTNKQESGMKTRW
ncbi:MAG: hypothetical protein L0Z50_30450 [Verrucomicrobiales bacterium]|nr:hypothetical protein [Verrucomicrobiales bacterium]